MQPYVAFALTKLEWFVEVVLSQSVHVHALQHACGRQQLNASPAGGGLDAHCNHMSNGSVCKLRT